MKKERSCLKCGESQEALLPKFGFSDEEIKDLLDKRLELDAKIAKYVLSNEEGLNMPNSIIRMSGQILLPWHQSCLWMISLQ